VKLPAAFMAIGVYLAVVLASPASAHAEPVESNPAACTTASTADQLTVVFGEELAADGSSVTVLAVDTVVASAGPDLNDLDHKTITAALPVGLTGMVTVQWTSRSAADGDEDAGSYQFAIGDSVDMSSCGSGAGQSSSGSSFPYILVGITAVAIGGLVMVRRTVGAKA